MSVAGLTASVGPAEQRLAGDTPDRYERERFHKKFWVSQMHPLPRPKNLKRIIKAQEGLDNILFIPEAVTLEHPLFRILGREKNVVNVNQNARVSLWQYL